MKRIAFILLSAGLSISVSEVALAQTVTHDQYAQLRHHDDRRKPDAHQRKDLRPQVRHHRRGEVLDRAYRRDVVGNHRRYGLRNPGRGESWVRVNGQFLLISSSGRILNIVPMR